MDRKASNLLPAVILGLLALFVTGCLGAPPPSGADCPGAPQAETGPQGDVHLSWEPVVDAESYPILRWEPDAEPTLVANVSGANTSHTDTSAEPGTTYLYVVHSWNGTARSTDCPTTEVTAVPFLPSLAATVAIGGLVAFGAFHLHKRG